MATRPSNRNAAVVKLAAQTVPDVDANSSRSAAVSARERRGQRRTLKDEVAAYIREWILSGEAKPGSKIDLEHVSDVIGVSKLPVREALIQLESEGLIETQPHRSSYVAMLTPDDVRDHYRIYGMLGGMAATRAASAFTSEDLDELERIVSEMESSDDMDQLEALNVAFHRRVNLVGSSGRLLAMIKYVANSLPGSFYQFTPGWAEKATRDHREILGLFRDRDADAAGRKMAEHSSAGAEVAVSVLTDRGYWDESADESAG